MHPLLEWASKTLTIGGVGAITTPLLILWIAWKGFPQIISAVERLILAFTDRSTKLAAGFDGQIARLEAQLKAADLRYEARDEECRERVAALQEEVDKLAAMIRGMRAQEQQRAASAVEMAERVGLPAAVGALLTALDTVPGIEDSGNV